MKRLLRRLVPAVAFGFDLKDWNLGVIVGGGVGIGVGFLLWLGPIEFGMGWD